MDLTRKRFLQVAALGAAAQPSPPVRAQVPAAQAPNAGTTRPNVLITMTDQHWRNYIESPAISTPNIDCIASRGIRLTNVIYPYPVCAASFMDGLRLLDDSLAQGGFASQSAFYVIRSEVRNL
jgi:hypothetical protein